MLEISANVRSRMPHLSKHVYLSYVWNNVLNPRPNQGLTWQNNEIASPEQFQKFI